MVKGKPEIFLFLISKNNIMKTKSFFFTLCTTLGFSSLLMAQTVSCSDFTVTGFSMDSLDSNKFNFSVEFSAPDTVFVNYPYISAVLDCNGDTVATGSFNFFGQFGQSTFEYPVTATGSLACLPLSVVFIYANDFLENDTCSLALSSVGLADGLKTGEAFAVYPNPTSTNVTIESTINQLGTNFSIYEYAGKLILKGTVETETTTVDLQDLPAGIYFMYIGENLSQSIKFVKQ
jgi:hypothetical protein